MKSKIQSIFLDIFFGSYAAILLHRILWFVVILDQKAPTFEWISLSIYVGIGAIFSIVSQIGKFSLGEKMIGITKYENSTQKAIRTHLAWILLSLTFITGWIVTKISIIDLLSQSRLEAAGRIFSNLLQPNFAILDEVLIAMVETIYLAFMSTILALPFSFILGFLSARNLMKRNAIAFAIYNTLRVILNFTRSIEPLVWAVIFTVWVKVGPFPGMLALMVHTISSLAKQYSEQIEDIDSGPMEAIEATGASPLQVIWFAVVPQIFIPFLSFTIYRWDINVRMATVIGLVGGGGIGTMLIQYQMLSNWREVGLIILVIALVVWVMDYASARIREALR